MKENFEAFVLRAVNYAERDVIVTLFTKERGAISAIAKNARTSKRFPGGIHLFRKVDAMVDIKPNRDVHIFVEMKVLAHYPNIESSYDKITVGSYGTELLRELGKGDVEGNPVLFALLEAFYRELDELGDDTQTVTTILHHFELRMLTRFGALPSLYTCHRCGTSHEDLDRLPFKRSGEGLLCPECRRPGEAVGIVDQDSLAILHYYHEPSGDPPEAMVIPEARQQARRIIENSFQLILQRDLKSRAMLETVLV